MLHLDHDGAFTTAGLPELAGRALSVQPFNDIPPITQHVTGCERGRPWGELIIRTRLLTGS